MKRLLCLLLSAILLIFLCACAGKKDKDGKGSSEDPKTAEETLTGGEEVATAPGQDDDKDEGPVEIGTLPIIFEDEKNEQNENEGSGSTPETTSGTNTPSTTTKKPETPKPETPKTSSTKGVVETPIIPFN